MRLHAMAHHIAETDVALLRVIDAVDDVEHGALAGAVGSDDRANFTFAHVEADVRQRPEVARVLLDAAKEEVRA